ncbi:C40 family peptidase [Chitinophaga rhizosphaerae]|uniref:C40 family peptidase n=1 Tax=Chitinophaga rhizosphaerae TaxID=1864947 RepID=UPI000F80388E|nr:C40 family peptidase [Chitinophaga rhizosphaerae]
MPLAITIVPVMPLRAEPSHRAEMISQAVFGECLETETVTQDGWVKVRMQYEGYEGWVTLSHLETIPQGLYEALPTHVVRHWQAVLQLNGKPVHVPYGSLLKLGATGWGSVTVTPGEGIVPFKPAPAPREAWEPIAMEFLNTGYLWGGKTVFGTDCSGFTQTVYKILGIPLLRDAYQQAAQGETVSFLQEVKPGDLAFFDNPEGRITHVGIMLDEQRIIHASGKVRIDPVDNQGIVNADTGERTHKLRLIKRLF